jgi:hypothetical protein
VGIVSLLTAERGEGIEAAVDFAGGAMLWARAPESQARMKQAARETNVLVFFMQAVNDFDTTPSLVLSEEMRGAASQHAWTCSRRTGRRPKRAIICVMAERASRAPCRGDCRGPEIETDFAVVLRYHCRAAGVVGHRFGVNGTTRPGSHGDRISMGRPQGDRTGA